MESSKARKTSWLSSKGATAVEFALILPLLITLIFGLVDFGRFFYVNISLAAASREAVRESSFNLEGCVNPQLINDPSGVPIFQDPCQIAPNNYVIYGELYRKIRTTAQSAAIGVEEISLSSSKVKLDKFVPCSLIPSISYTEVTISKEFNWLLPIDLAQGTPYSIKSNGYMKCLN